MTDQAVRVERSGPVSTVFLHRPARRNAVDGPTAAQLAEAFRAFDADPAAAGAVLHGEGGGGGGGCSAPAPPCPRWAPTAATGGRPTATGQWGLAVFGSLSRSSRRS